MSFFFERAFFYFLLSYLIYKFQFCVALLFDICLNNIADENKSQNYILDIF